MFFFKKGITAGVILALLMYPGLSTGTAGAELVDVVDTKDQQDIILYLGDIVTMKVHSLTKISVSKPNVVNIVSADVQNITIIGKAEGKTTFYIWDEYGKRAVYVRVLKDDLDRTKASTEKLMQAANIEGLTLEKDVLTGKLIASGRVSVGDAKVVEDTIGDVSNQVISLYQEGGDLIQLDVQVTELTTTLSKILGFNWSGGASSGFALPYTETLPAFGNDFDDLFKIGDFARTQAITATVNALISEGKARVLSKPSIIVSDGEEAEFLVGGEIPVRSTTTSAGGNTVTENITYTEYGVSLTATPTLAQDKVEIILSVAIRDIDASNAVGDDVAFTTREASTKVLLNDGQTIVLAGLIKHNSAENMSRVPFLGSIPIVGLLFRNRSETPNSDTEVVISMTPRVISQDKKETLPGEQDETSWDLDMPQDIDEDLALADESWAGESFNDSAETEDSLLDAEGFDEAEPLLDDMADEGLPAPEQTGEAPAEAITQYVQTVQQKIARGISFPYEAKENGWSGTVVLTLGLLSDGSLTAVDVKESSGQKVFDKDAVNTTQILAPFDPFPAEIDLEELEVTIPIVYSQEAVLEGGGV